MKKFEMRIPMDSHFGVLPSVKKLFLHTSLLPAPVPAHIKLMPSQVYPCINFLCEDIFSSHFPGKRIKIDKIFIL